MDDRTFMLQIDGEGEPGGEGQQHLIDFELEGVNAAQYPGFSAERLFLERFFIKPHPEVVSGGELLEVVSYAVRRTDGVGRKGRNEHCLLMIELFDFIDLSGADSGNPL